MVKVDRMVHFYCEIFSSNKWLSFQFFPKFEGIETRGPLSPYLFVIAMEVFSCLLRRAINGVFLSGWKVRGRSGEGVLISHLLFADDTLVFCEESLDQMTYLS